ncbi:MAG TPA: PP2C family serine/threonine-protein phosphatase [Candidatus Sulfotelmatobacter sp.]
MTKLAADSPKARPGVNVACLTDVGLLRENNEDSYLYWEPERDADFRDKGRLGVIADGMGGYEGGQEASRIAVQTVREVYENARHHEPKAVLLEALTLAHGRIQSYGLEHPAFQGMGTTCTAFAILGPQLYFGHVGDSRLYLIRDGIISKLTRDHSYVSRLVESGIVRSEDAESHPQRHILTAALGSGTEVAADISTQPVPLKKGDVLILCTDGLWGQVTEAELVSAAKDKSAVQACLTLARLALERGGPDNITLQVLRFTSD